MCYRAFMLVGTGIDLVEIERVAHSIERYGDRFLNKVFTPEEILTVSERRILQRALPRVLPPRRQAPRPWARAFSMGFRGKKSRSDVIRASGPRYISQDVRRSLRNGSA